MRARKADEFPTDGITISAVDWIAEHAFQGVFVDDREELRQSLRTLRVLWILGDAQDFVLPRLGERCKAAAEQLDAQPIDHLQPFAIQRLEVAEIASDDAIDVDHCPGLARARTLRVAWNQPARDRVDNDRLIGRKVLEALFQKRGFECGFMS